MGLCKCPKRRVTNQFCFEHRVNVCEHCMVQKHPNVSPNFHFDLLTGFNNQFRNYKIIIVAWIFWPITCNKFYKFYKSFLFSSVWYKVIYNGFKTVTTTQIVHFVMKNLQMNLVFVYRAIVSLLKQKITQIKNSSYFIRL